MTDTYATKQFPVGLFEIGPSFVDCLFAWCCTPCANAQARTNMDNSPCCFNFMCMNHVLQRAVTKQAYGLEYDCTKDCMAATCCTCCSVNQVYQSSKMMEPAPIQNVGPQFQTKANPVHNAPCSVFNCLYACLCTPCAYGTALNEAFGLNFFLGCCCSNPMIGQNLLRYHDNIMPSSSDYWGECCYPFLLYIFAGCFPCCLVALPMFVAWLMQGPTMAQNATKGPYLAGTKVDSEQLLPNGGVVVGVPVTANVPAVPATDGKI